jgi:hypothetical protein
MRAGIADHLRSVGSIHQENILMPINESDELQAKATIAAALIQAQVVGLHYNEEDVRRPWVDNEALIRLNKLTHRVYEAIRNSPSRESV